MTIEVLYRYYYLEVQMALAAVTDSGWMFWFHQSADLGLQ